MPPRPAEPSRAEQLNSDTGVVVQGGIFFSKEMRACVPMLQSLRPLCKLEDLVHDLQAGGHLCGEEKGGWFVRRCCEASKSEILKSE